MSNRLFLSALVAVAAAGCATRPEPEMYPLLPTPPKPDGMVAAADPRAVDAGLQMLERGGSAVDASIAAMMVLGLVEPQSAGVGGGGFMLVYDKSDQDVDAYDGREAAPAGADESLLLDANGKPLPYGEAVASGLSTGAPALMPMLKKAHEEHGRLPWGDLFEPAIWLAEQGFEVSPRLHNALVRAAQSKALPEDPQAREIFFLEDGSPAPVGYTIRNPAYAATLRALQKVGPKALQEGALAEAIVTAVQRDPRPGNLKMADLQAHHARAVEPLCGEHRGYRICGMGPPSAGGVTVLSILGLYERARPEPVGPANVDDWHAFLWASRIAYADRDHYVADDTFVPVPVAGLIDSRYLDMRARQMAPGVAPHDVAAGDPSVVSGGESIYGRWGPAITQDAAGTTHLSIVDRDGNAAALTATIEGPFGSQRMAGGFVLNNQLTDFSFSPTRGGKPVANAPAGGKRPRSSMAPTIILEPDGDFYAAVGSPGGSGIIAYVSKTIIGAIDWKLPLEEAVALPNLIARSPEVSAEMDRLAPDVATGLEARGWKLKPVTTEASRIHAVRKLSDGKLEGAADPRGEGVAKPTGKMGPVG